MMLDLLRRLPHLPVSPEAGLLISAFVVSVAAALIVLIRNRRLLRRPVEEESDLGAVFENPASLLPHIVELRDRIIKSLIAILIGTVLATLMSQQILTLLAAPIGGLEALQAIRVTEPFGTFFRVALVVGIILASPYVITQLWVFIAAGLKPTERRIFYLFVPFAMLLFLAGVVFAYTTMLPVAVPFLVSFMGINATPTLEDYVSFVTNVLLWVGISFEMPLILFVLAKLKIVSTAMLIKNWRIAIVLIAALAAIVTPTPDPVNMGIVAAPLIALYVLSIVLTLFA